MEHTKVEMNVLEKTVEQAEEVRELSDMQLALVGGGSGDVVFH